MATLMILQNSFFLIYFLTSYSYASAGPIQNTNIDFDKENRAGHKPTFPVAEDFRRTTSQIIQANEVLRVALRDFLDYKDANLTTYLDVMRKQKEPYLDETGQVIPGYKTIFGLIQEQVDEVANNNYAADFFEDDRHDHCSVARYLSHQAKFNDKSNILKKMGDALGQECSPCVWYKRNKYDDERDKNPIKLDKLCVEQLKIENSGHSSTTSAPVSSTTTESTTTSTTSSTETLSAKPSPIPLIHHDNKEETPLPTNVIASPPSKTFHPSKELMKSLCDRKPVFARLRNALTKEYLFVDEDHTADVFRRRVFTWRDLKDIPGEKGNNWHGEEIFHLEPIDACTKSARVSVGLEAYPKGPLDPGFLYVHPTDLKIYSREGFDDADEIVAELGLSAVWDLIAVTEEGFRRDICDLERHNITGFMLRNAKYGDGYLNADTDDIFDVESDKLRRNVHSMSSERSIWEIIAA